MSFRFDVSGFRHTSSRPADPRTPSCSPAADSRPATLWRQGVSLGAVQAPRTSLQAGPQTLQKLAKTPHPTNPCSYILALCHFSARLGRESPSQGVQCRHRQVTYLVSMAHLSAAPLSIHTWPQARCLCAKPSAHPNSASGTVHSVARRVPSHSVSRGAALHSPPICNASPCPDRHHPNTTSCAFSVSDLSCRARALPPESASALGRSCPYVKASEVPKPRQRAQARDSPSPRSHSPREALIAKSRRPR